MAGGVEERPDLWQPLARARAKKPGTLLRYVAAERVLKPARNVPDFFETCVAAHTSGAGVKVRGSARGGSDLVGWSDSNSVGVFGVRDEARGWFRVQAWVRYRLATGDGSRAAGGVDWGARGANGGKGVKDYAGSSVFVGGC